MTTPATDRGDGDAAVRDGVVAVAALACASAAETARFWNSDTDDAYIVYRYAQNLVRGDGWSFNPGEAHNASTSVLNPLLTALATAFTGDAHAAGHLVGGAALLAAGLGAWALVRRFASGAAALVCAVAVVHVLACSSTWGLETHLFVALVLLHAACRPGSTASWALAALATLARPDAGLLLAILGLAHLVRERRWPVRGTLVAAAILLPWIVYATARFGTPVPDTLTAKRWQGASGFWGAGPVYLLATPSRLWNCLEAALRDGTSGPIRESPPRIAAAAVTLLVLAGLSLRGFLAELRGRGPLLAPFAFIALAQLAYAVLDVPPYHWYYVPAVVGLVLASARGLFARSGPPSGGTPRAWAVAVLLCLGIVRPWSAFAPLPPEPRIGAYHAAAVHAAASAPPGAIAAIEAGAIACASDRPILDLTGLTSPHGEFMTGRRNDAFFALAPAAVVLHDPPWPHERAIAEDPRLAERFTPSAFRGADPRYPLRVFLRR